ncbi:MAG: flagellar filament capping protein FliD, partial [Actinomycetota bacterium]|nr:flagellar filament capping protein FliD [Actinomycetota bacterium]
MAQPAFRVGGIASGLDTESIINSLVQIERIPINRMAVQRQVAQQRTDAWTSINTQVSGFRTTVDDLRYGGGLQASAVASNQPDTVLASVTGAATPSTTTFSVDQVAATHSVTTANGLAEETTAVGAGTITLTIGADTHVITADATTTLADVASSIDALGVGVDASVLKVADGDHRLQVTSQTSGLGGAFTVTNAGTSLGAERILSQGADALLTIGSGVGAVQVSRASNVIGDLVPGVELQILGISTSDVTISTERDVEAIADNITAMYNAANTVLLEIDRLTAYDEASDTAAPLTGDSMARTLDTNINDALIESINDLGLGLVGGPPVSFSRTGEVEVDRDRLITALRDEFATLESVLSGRFAADDGRLTPISTSSATLPGTYDVTVTDGGTSPIIVGSAYVASGSDEDFNIEYGATNVLVGIGAGSTIASAITQINDALTLAGVSQVEASDNGGAIELTTPGLVSTAESFVVSSDDLWGLNGTFTGTDSAGFIGGETATAGGSQYSATSGSPNGLVVDV